MWVRVLGSAAGGGFPQWNCDCPGCRAVRTGARPATPRTQSSIALSADGHDWYLVNASPDVRAQIDATPALHPRDGRRSPVRGVLLTDAEIDHTLGLLLLREGRGVEVHATDPTLTTLHEGTGVLRTLERYCPVDARPVALDVDTPLGDTGITYRAFDAPTDKAPRFGPGAPGGGAVVGYRFTDTTSGARVVYLPGVQEFTGAVLAELRAADLVLVDGTCWTDDELVTLGIGTKTAHAMGHVAMSGPEGSLAVLAGLPATHRVYVHVNNSNPVLLEDSPERAEVERAGVEVAADGWELEVVRVSGARA